MWVGGVRVLIFDNEDRLLMVKQHHEDRDIWMVPGGGIEEMETAHAAAIREMKEETNLDIKIGRLVWHIEEVSKERGQRFVNYYVGNVVGGELSLGIDPEFDSEHQRMRELRFVSRDEIKTFEIVFPNYLRDELWEIKEKNFTHTNIYKIRRNLHEEV
ncbi:MAG: NUDIX hydrolase [Anaerovoracaceae bacterium]